MFFETLMASTPGPTADYWYQPRGLMSAAGVPVDAEGARKLAAWYRGRDLLATTLAMLPWNVYERLPNDAGSEVARANPLYDILHTKPNAWQNSYDYRRMKMFHLIDFGNGYDLIVEGARGFVDQLWPIHPTLVRPEQLSSKRVVFHVRDPQSGLTKTFTQDEIFHLRGASDDGVVGKGVLQYARDSIGLGLTVDNYSSQIFGKGTIGGGYLKNPGLLNDEAARRMAQSFVTKPGEWGLPKILEQGSEFTESKMSPEDFQMLTSRQYSVTEVARWLGIPPHMLGDLERATFSNIEHQGQEFVTYSLGPWLSLFEFSANDQLVLNTSRFYTEFVREALVRGDITARSAADVAYVNAGIETVDEVRGRNNRNKRGGKADELRDPQNITGKGTEGGPQDNQRPGFAGDGEGDAKARARAIVAESASRVQRKEVFAARRSAVTHAKDVAEFDREITDFYAKHQALVEQTLCLSPADAQLYCDSQRDDLLGQGISVAETWTPNYLIGLALDAPRPDPKDLLLHAALSQPAPAIQVNAGIEKGAVVVEASAPPQVHIDAPVTVHPAVVTIAEGAMQHTAHTTIKEAEPTGFTVEKTVTRGSTGIEKVVEHHKPTRRTP